MSLKYLHLSFLSIWFWTSGASIHYLLCTHTCIVQLEYHLVWYSSHFPHFDCFLNLENGSLIVHQVSIWLLDHSIRYQSAIFDGLFKVHPGCSQVNNLVIKYQKICLEKYDNLWFLGMKSFGVVKDKKQENTSISFWEADGYIYSVGYLKLFLFLPFYTV